jgi:hypothetical protein
MLWYGPYRPLQSGIELGSVLLLSQFNLERGDLLLGLCERGRCAADLRDEFVKGGAVHLQSPFPIATRRPRQLHSRESKPEANPQDRQALGL